MLQKGIIRKIDNASKRAYVFIPIFQNAASSEEILFKCPFSYQPGNLYGYNVGDVVFVDFENNQLDHPVVVGKLFTENSETNSNAISGNGLNIEGRTTLSKDTKIGDISYDDLSNLINKTDALDETVKYANSALDNMSEFGLNGKSSDENSYLKGSVSKLEFLLKGIQDEMNEIQNLLGELVYKQPEFTVKPTWKLNKNTGEYDIFYAAYNPNMDNGTTDKDLITSASIEWIPFNYCSLLDTTVNQHQTKQFTDLDDSESVNYHTLETAEYEESEIVYKEKSITETLGNGEESWTSPNWKVMRSGAWVNKRTTFPRLVENGANYYINMHWLTTDKSKAYGTSNKYLSLDMLNRNISNSNIVPYNYGIIDNFTGNLWYEQPAIISDWQLNFTGRYEKTDSSDSSQSILNYDSTCNLNLTIANVKHLTGIAESILRFAIYFTVDYRIPTDTNSVQGTETIRVIEGPELTSLFYGTNAKISINLIPSLTKLFIYDFGPEKAREMVAKLGKYYTEEANPQGTYYCKVSNLAVEYFYTPSQDIDSKLTYSSISQPICNVLRKNDVSTKLEDLYSNTNSTYNQVMNSSYQITPLQEGDQLRSPKILQAKFRYYNTDSPHYGIVLALQNDNYINAINDVTDAVNVKLSGVTQDKLKIVLYNEDGQKPLIGNVFNIKIDSTINIIPDAQYKYEPPATPDEWIEKPGIAELEIELTSDVFDPQVAYDDFQDAIDDGYNKVCMQSIKFIADNYMDSNYVEVRDCGWTESIDNPPSNMLNIDQQSLQYEEVSQKHTITWYQADVDLPNPWAEPAVIESDTVYTVPVEFPQVTLNTDQKANGWFFTGWFIKTDDGYEPLVAGSLLEENISVYALWDRYYKEVTFSGFEHNADSGKINNIAVIKVYWGETINSNLFNTPLSIDRLVKAKSSGVWERYDEDTLPNFISNPESIDGITLDMANSFSYAYYWRRYDSTEAVRTPNELDWSKFKVDSESSPYQFYVEPHQKVSLKFEYLDASNSWVVGDTKATEQYKQTAAPEKFSIGQPYNYYHTYLPELTVVDYLKLKTPSDGSVNGNNITIKKANPNNINYGVVRVYPKRVKEGCWFNCPGAAFIPSGNTSMHANLTLYKTYTNDKVLSELNQTNVYRKYYNLVGWKNNNTEEYLDTTELQPTTNGQTTFIAVWKRARCTITFEYNVEESYWIGGNVTPIIGTITLNQGTDIWDANYYARYLWLRGLADGGYNQNTDLCVASGWTFVRFKDSDGNTFDGFTNVEENTAIEVWAEYRKSS